MNKTEQLRTSILKALEAGKILSFKWDCGGDEAIISVYLNGEMMSYHNAFVEELSFYLFNKLKLPDAGEFVMQGEGKLLLENDILFLEYESKLKGYDDFDEEFNHIGWKEVDEIVPEHSGKIILFDE